MVDSGWVIRPVVIDSLVGGDIDDAATWVSVIEGLLCLGTDTIIGTGRGRQVCGLSLVLAFE